MRKKKQNKKKRIHKENNKKTKQKKNEKHLKKCIKQTKAMQLKKNL